MKRSICIPRFITLRTGQFTHASSVNGLIQSKNKRIFCTNEKFDEKRKTVEPFQSDYGDSVVVAMREVNKEFQVSNRTLSSEEEKKYDERMAETISRSRQEYYSRLTKTGERASYSRAQSKAERVAYSAKGSSSNSDDSRSFREIPDSEVIDVSSKRPPDNTGAFI